MAGAGFWYVKYGPGANKEPEQTPAEKVQAAAIDAQDAQLAGDSDKAKQMVNEAIDYTAGDSVAQADAYVLKSSIAFKDKDYQAALDAAREAERLNPTSLTSALIGNAAKELKDDKLAAEYYQITIDRIKALEFYNETDVKYYEGLLKEVEG